MNSLTACRHTAGRLRLSGAATFLKVPALTQILELPEDWGRACRTCGSRLSIEQRGLKRRVEGRLRKAAQV